MDGREIDTISPSHFFSSKNEILRLAIKYIRLLDQVAEYQRNEDKTKEHAENCHCDLTEGAVDGRASVESEQKINSSMNGDASMEETNGKCGSSGFESPTFNFSNSPDSIFDFSSDSESEPN